MKRNNITPAKGNEAAAYEGRRHTVRAALRTALYSAVELGVRVGEGVGSEGVRSTRGSLASPPSWLLQYCSWPRKVTQNFMKNIPIV